MPRNRRKRKFKVSAGKGGPYSAGWHEGVAARLNAIAGDGTLSDIAGATGAHAETVRRYMNTGKVSIEFLAAFCLAFKADPRWVLFGSTRKMSSAGRRR